MATQTLDQKREILESWFVDELKSAKKEASDANATLAGFSLVQHVEQSQHVAELIDLALGELPHDSDSDRARALLCGVQAIVKDELDRMNVLGGRVRALMEPRHAGGEVAHG